MTKGKFRTKMNALFSFQFAYCPLIWMFQNRTLNNKINKLQERVLLLVHNDNTFSFYELLQDIFEDEKLLSWKFIERAFKTSLQDTFKMCSASHFFVSQDVWKTSLRQLVRCFQDIFKTSPSCLGRQKNFMLKTCWRRLQEMSWAFSQLNL